MLHVIILFFTWIGKNDFIIKHFDRLVKSDLCMPTTVLPRLSNPIGTKTCSDNQKVWIIKYIAIHEIDKNSYFAFTSDLTLRRYFVKVLTNSYFEVTLSSIDKTIRLSLVVMLIFCKISINH